MKAFGTIVGLIGLAGMGVAICALVRGRLVWASILNRKVAGAVLAGAFIVTAAGGALSGGDDPKARVHTDVVAAPAALSGSATTTTTEPTTSTTAAPVTTTTLAATTTTAKAAPITTTTTRATTTTSTEPASTTSSSSTTTTGPTTATTLGKCQASVDNPTPLAGANVTVSVTSTLADQPFTATAHYKSKDTVLTGALDPTGRGFVIFDTGNPTSGYRVYVDIKIATQAATCRTFFTPA